MSTNVQQITLLNPRIKVQSDKNFYDSNENFVQLTELVCYERPIFFILEFYFGISELKIWLYDRHKILFRDNRLINNGQALDVFLSQSKLAINHQLHIRAPEDLAEVIQQNVNTQQSMVVTVKGNLESYYTSIIIEGHSAASVIATSLQGDDFYVRREISYQNLFNKVFINNGQLEYQILNFDQNNLDLLLQKGIEHHRKISDKTKSNPFNFNPMEHQSVISAFLNYQSHKIDEYLLSKSPKALLGFVYWPLINTLCPYFIYLRHILKKDPLTEERKNILLSMNKFDQIDHLITIKGMIAKRDPSSENTEKFFSTLASFADLYLSVISDSSKIIGILD